MNFDHRFILGSSDRIPIGFEHYWNVLCLRKDSKRSLSVRNWFAPKARKEHDRIVSSFFVALYCTWVFFTKSDSLQNTRSFSFFRRSAILLVKIKHVQPCDERKKSVKANATCPNSSIRVLGLVRDICSHFIENSRKIRHLRRITDVKYILHECVLIFAKKNYENFVYVSNYSSRSGSIFDRHKIVFIIGEIRVNCRFVYNIFVHKI